MSQQNLSSAEAVRYVQSLEIDRAESFRASTDEAPSQGVFERGAGTANQAVVIGSQITEFAAEMEPEQCEQIANSLLLAQLAASKKSRQRRGLR